MWDHIRALWTVMHKLPLTVIGPNVKCMTFGGDGYD